MNNDDDGEDATTTAEKYYNIFREASNVISSCSYYDELITKLQVQAMTEYEYDMLKQPDRKPYPQKLQDQQEIHSQTKKKKKKMLLVDDEPDHCLIYQIVLQDAGYECISYTDSVAALLKFKPSFYDLIILDIKMPKLDGFALCEKIREVDKSVPIIFITAAEQFYEKFRNKYYPKLSNDPNINCLQKPIGNEELIKIVNMTIATKDTS